MSDERTRASFLGLVYLLRQMTMQLVEQGQVEEARGFVDAIESLEVKTKGNLDAEEEQVVTAVLTELRMAVVKGAPGSDESA